MDKLEKYRQIIVSIVKKHAQYNPSHVYLQISRFIYKCHTTIGTMNIKATPNRCFMIVPIIAMFK